MVTKAYLGAGDVVHDDTAVAAPVEGGADALEALLARGVPDLQRVALVVVGDVLRNEIGAHSGAVLGAELPGDVPLHEAGLADAKR